MKRIATFAIVSVLAATACAPAPTAAPAMQPQPPMQPAPAPVPPSAAPAAAPAASATHAGRTASFNGRVATGADWQIIVQLETMYGRQLPDGAYWYDRTSGATGMWGGPTIGFVAPGLELGAPLPANASGGGSGQVTGVFINGREIHAQDHAALVQMLGQVYPGRWWVDAQGNAGQEGGPPLFNVYVVAQQRRQASGGGDSVYRSDGRGNNVFVGKGCVAVNGSKSTDSGSVSTSYYVGCE